MIRSHDAGTLRADHIGQSVTLAGWVARRRDHGGVAFIDLRDASGVAQVVIRDEETARPLRSEFCLRVVGEVATRPPGNANPQLATGEVEVIAHEVEVLSEAAALPFPVEEHHMTPVSEEVRFKYRYLDLRRSGPAAALRLRSEVNKVARDVLGGHDFVEVETPTLTRSTPEGARDFLVPARLQPGSWYALPQSPQLFKQLLMVAGLERYFQIARCYRDEDFRADRQPEFTQLDIEMSFVEQDDVIELGEAVVAALWRELAGHEVSLPIPRMTYAEAMARYGSDKPDLRYTLELTELTEYFSDTPFRVFQALYVGAVVMPGGADQPRKQLDAWQEWAKQRGSRGLAYVLVGADGELSGPVAKNLSDAEREGLAKAVGAEPGDCIFFAAGAPADARTLLGAARNEIAQRTGMVDESAWSFVWIVDAPMFEPIRLDDGSQAWTALHHPFTSPAPEWADQFDEQPGEAVNCVVSAELNAPSIGAAQASGERAQHDHRCARMRLEVGAELPPADLSRDDRADRHHRGATATTGLVDRRQLTDRVTWATKREQRLPSVRGRAEHLDRAFRDDDDVVGLVALGEDHATARVATWAPELQQVPPIVVAEH